MRPLDWHLPFPPPPLLPSSHPPHHAPLPTALPSPSQNVDHMMHDYIFRRRVDGIQIINVEKTLEKIQLAARVIVTIENPSDVICVSSRPYAQRAVLKYAQYTGAQHMAGRYTPGTFTNQITKQVRALARI
jgi:small subunit ribosomal protein SAe